jgi:hypothetical protein
VQPVGPARTAEDYELKAADTATTVASALRTADLAGGTAVEGRSFGPYVAVVLGEAEDDAAGAASTFESVQPPGASSDRLRAELGELTSEADDALSALRIAARRNDRDAISAHLDGLEELASELDQFADEHGAGG